MFEFVVVAKNLPIHPQEEMALQARYAERSLLSEPYTSWRLPIFGDKAILLGRSRFEHQGSPVFRDQHGFTCLDGYLVSERLATRSDDVVKQVHRILLDSQDRDWLSNCLGEFLIVHYNDRRRLLEFLCSELRTVPLYLREGKDAVCVSNRASLCNVGFEGKPQLNVLGQLAHVAALESLQGDTTAFEEVRFLPRDRSALLRYPVPDNRRGAPELIMLERERSWAVPGVEVPTMEEVLEETRSITTWLLEHLRLFRKQINVQGGGKYGLSGGKDSRLVLALLAESRLVELYDGVFTFGSEAEIVAAATVAAHYNLDQEVQPWQKRSPGWFFQSLGRHIFEAEGEVNCHDPTVSDPLRSLHGKNLARLDITGHEGSALRAYLEHVKSDEKSDEVARKYLREAMLIDPIGVLKAEVVEDMRRGLLDDYERSLARHTRPENFFNLRRIEQRVPRWTGKHRQVHSATALVSNILCAPPLFTLAHNMGSENRRRELLHLGMLAALDPKLLRYPFAEQKWRPPVMAAFGERYRLLEYAVTNPMGRRPSGGWYATLQKNGGRSLGRTISDLAHPDTEGLIDYQKLMNFLSVLSETPEVHGSVISIMGVVSANLLLHAQDVSRDGASRTQAIVEVAKKNFERPDSVPVYFAHKLLRSSEERSSEDAVSLRERTETLEKQNKDLRIRVKTLKKQNKDLRIRATTQKKRLRAMQNTRAWWTLSMAARLKKKLFRR